MTVFLLKILDPAFFVRDRPNRASPRATKKAGDFPARKDQPSVVRVTLNRPGFARGWGSGHLAPLGDGVSIHDFAFNWCHVVDG